MAQNDDKHITFAEPDRVRDLHQDDGDGRSSGSDDDYQRAVEVSFHVPPHWRASRHATAASRIRSCFD